SQHVRRSNNATAPPSLLLCDEPTGNLDSLNAATVLDTIDALHADGMTVLMITHDPAVSARAETAGSWVIISTVMPSACSASMVSSTVAALRLSRLPVGSSQSSRLGGAVALLDRRTCWL